jgi:hypothetical protein
MLKIIALYLFLLTQNSLSNVIIPDTDADLTLTIYNNNKAFINEKRQVLIKEGKQKLIYQGIPNQVITQSVVPSFSKIDTQLYSQNYSYDLISQNSMLENSLDKLVYYYPNNDEKNQQTGTLLATSPVLVRNQSGQIETLKSPTQVVFTSVPKTMITKPSLVWNINSAQSGNLSIDLKYLTRGISWKSDYVLNLSQNDFDLKGWITIDNHSGTAYKNANIACIAGDINNTDKRAFEKNSIAVLYAEPIDKLTVSEESFSGYHLYKIPFKETIENKQQKQIAFIDQNKVRYHQYGQAQNSYFGNYKQQELQFNNTLVFSNTQKNHLGIPLPAGIVRMYQKSSDGKTRFIGESRIKNTPKNESIKLTIGTLFDVVGEKRISKYIVKPHYKNIETIYTVHNQSKEPVEVRIEEHIPTYGNNINLNSSCTQNCTLFKKSAFSREFIINLLPESNYKFSSSFEVNY